MLPPLKHLLFFVAEDWYFCSHRLPLAQAAIAAGFKVTLVTQVHRHVDTICSSGINLIPIKIFRSGLNPVRELALIAKLYQIYHRERPDIVHHVAMKPVIYGTIAARLAGIPRIINALAGLGFLFISHHLLARLLKPLVQLILRWVLGGNTQIILQNPDDMRLLCERVGLSLNKVHLIYGVGADLKKFIPMPFPPETSAGPIILFPARLLWDKGIGEFIKAAKMLQEQGVVARYVLAGAPDFGNPSAVSQEQLESWVNFGLVTWLGHCEDMPTVFQNSHIVCLPSYREGLPKSLVEAIACGRPIVTTDTPGCREVVHDGKNGLLVPVKDATALANALIKLIQNHKLREIYGHAGRQLAVEKFDSEQIIAQTLAVYNAIT